MAKPAPVRGTYVTRASVLLRALVVSGAFGAFLLVSFFEVLADFPVPWKWYLGVVAACAVALIECGVPLRAWIVRAGIVLLIAALSATLYFVDWSSRKVFLRDLDRVKVGMTEAEVRGIMGRYMEGTGWPVVPPGVSPVRPKTPNSQSSALLTNGAQYPVTPSPTEELRIRDSLVFRHSNKWYYDSDWGTVTFKAGRVVGVHFSPD
jgi:hypothetical protein